MMDGRASMPCLEKLFFVLTVRANMQNSIYRPRHAVCDGKPCRKDMWTWVTRHGANNLCIYPRHGRKHGTFLHWCRYVVAHAEHECTSNAHFHQALLISNLLPSIATRVHICATERAVLATRLCRCQTAADMDKSRDDIGCLMFLQGSSFPTSHPTAESTLKRVPLQEEAHAHARRQHHEHAK